MVISKGVPILRVNMVHCLIFGLYITVSSMSDYRSRGHKLNPQPGHITFVEIDRKIFSTVILSLPLIQERHFEG